MISAFLVIVKKKNILYDFFGLGLTNQKNEEKEEDTMKKNSFVSFIVAAALSVGLITGCGNSQQIDSNTVNNNATSTEDSTQTEKSAMSNEETEAMQLLSDLEGTYQELWPVALEDAYTQVWINSSSELVGEENAQAAVEKMQSMVTAEIYGQEAVDIYTDGNMAYDCSFLQGVVHFSFDGNKISGIDETGEEVFSHTYHYVGMEEVRGLYEYESDDTDSGEFSYFCLAPDTSETTYHIEFRYGSDLENLGKYDAGPYAYWLAAGISTDYDQTMVENSIKLFCTENLTE